jgi:hypothetical protein
VGAVCCFSLLCPCVLVKDSILIHKRTAVHGSRSCMRADFSDLRCYFSCLPAQSEAAAAAYYWNGHMQQQQAAAIFTSLRCWLAQPALGRHTLRKRSGDHDVAHADGPGGPHGPDTRRVLSRHPVWRRTPSRQGAAALSREAVQKDTQRFVKSCLAVANSWALMVPPPGFCANIFIVKEND